MTFDINELFQEDAIIQPHFKITFAELILTDKEKLCMVYNHSQKRCYQKVFNNIHYYVFGGHVILYNELLQHVVQKDSGFAALR